MTNKEAIEILKDCELNPCVPKDKQAVNMAIKALEQEPYEKFENVKDHIYKLASDYKCWDNRITDDEAIELCHILEQEPILDKIREEIKALSNANPSYWHCGDMVEREEVFDIIDEYRTDRSDEE